MSKPAVKHYLALAAISSTLMACSSTPLTRVIQYESAEAALARIEETQDPSLLDIPDSSGRTPLCIAAFQGELPVVQALIEHGADVNLTHTEWNAVVIAVTAEHFEVADYLLANGADLNADDGGAELLVDLIAREAVDRAEYLIAHGVSVEGYNGSLALLTAVREMGFKTLEDEGGGQLMFSFSSRSDGAPVEEPELQEMSPELKIRYRALVGNLLRAGADPNRLEYKDYSSAVVTPSGSSESLAFGGTRGEIVTAGQGELTALGLARSEGLPEIASMLVEYGAK